MKFLSSIFILEGTLLFVLSAVGLFKPLPRLWIATRKRAVDALLCSLGSCVVGGIIAPSDDRTTPATAETASEQPRQKGGLTMEDYRRLQNGMSYDEVVEILGGEGTESLSSGDSTDEIVTLIETVKGARVRTAAPTGFEPTSENSQQHPWPHPAIP